MSVINTNYLALVSQNNLTKSQGALGTAIERLSSGLRINSAKDDAAGQAIANRFTANIKGLTQATRNANDGISIAQTTEGALNEINNNLQRVRELTVQAANGSNSDSDLQSIQAEIDQRLVEIDRVSKQTQFNGVNVLAKDNQLKIQVGANDNEAININLKEISTSTLQLSSFTVQKQVQLTQTAVEDVDPITSPAFDAAIADGAIVGDASAYVGPVTFTIKTADDGYYVHATFDSGADAGTATAKNNYLKVNVNEVTGAVAFDSAASWTSTAPTGLAGTAAVDMNADLSAAETALGAAPGDASLVALSNTATGDALGYAIKVGSDLYKAKVDSVTGAVTLDAKQLTYKAADGTNTTTYATLGGLTGTQEVVKVGTDIYSADALAGADLTQDTIKQVATSETGSPLEALDAALQTVDSLRSDLGAIQNRFQSTIANLSNTITNLSAARSRIEDADYAVEVSNMTRAQILQQAGTSVLAQANQVPQGVLSLLR